MSTRTDIVAEYYAAFNRRDPEVYARLFTSDCEISAPGVQARGIDALRGFDLVWTSAFSEGRIENLHLIESPDGQVLASNWFHGGTHVQPLPTPAGEIPATGRIFSAPYCATFEFEGRKITSQRLVFDAEYVPVALGVPRAEASVDVVKDIYAAFGRGDLAGVMNRIDATAELQFEGSPSIPWSGHFQGKNGWTAFFQTIGGNVDQLSVAMEPFAVQGEHVACAGRYQGVVRATGQRIDSPLVHLWTVKQGKVVHCIELTNTAAEATACIGAAALAR